MIEKSLLESAAGSLPVAATANFIAVVGSIYCPFASLLPFLATTLATQRQSERVDSMLLQLSQAVEALQLDASKITDDQHKFAGECVVAALSTVSQEKLEYLQSAAVRALAEPEISAGISDALARLVRDISAEEWKFALQNFEFRGITIDKTLEAPTGTLMVRPDSHEEFLVGGLIRLGLLYTRAMTWDAQMYEWSPLTAKLIALVGSPTGLWQNSSDASNS